MTVGGQRHWIGGTWCASASGGDFAGPAEGGADAGAGLRWPRSDPGDVAAALDAARASAALWRDTGMFGRRERLEPALAALAEAGPRLARQLGAAVGLDPDETAPAHGIPRDALAGVLSPWGAGLEDGETAPVVVAADWREAAGGLALRVFEQLVAGRVVIVVSDPRLPRAAQAVAEALAAADLPRGVAAVLHDDGLSCLRALWREVGRWSACEGDERVLEVLDDRAVGAEPTVAWSLARRTTAVVRRADAVGPAARALAEKAVGRSSTLSGQLPGQVGRVVCHELCFSSLTEALLGALDELHRTRGPVPLMDDRASRYAQGASALGLDEGACLIQGGEPWPATDRFGRCGVRTWVPGVFTNVDPGLRFARLQRPAPILALVRVSTDGQAERLRRELDLDLTERHARLDSP